MAAFCCYTCGFMVEKRITQ